MTCAVLAGREVGFSVELLHHGLALVQFVFVVALAALVGFVLALFPGRIPFDVLGCVRERINGGPFVVGDTVQIIGGPLRGRVGRISQMGQGRAYFWVELEGEEGSEKRPTLEPVQCLLVKGSDRRAIPYVDPLIRRRKAVKEERP